MSRYKRMTYRLEEEFITLEKEAIEDLMEKDLEYTLILEGPAGTETPLFSGPWGCFDLYRQSPVTIKIPQQIKLGLYQNEKL